MNIELKASTPSDRVRTQDRGKLRISKLNMPMQLIIFNY